MANIGELAIALIAKVGPFRLSMKKAKRSVKDLGDGAKRTAGQLRLLGGTIVGIVATGAMAKMVNSEEGSLKKFVADPELYNHLNRTAASMSILMRNMEPLMRDLQIFADKVARHPELIGLGGALKNSSGLK